MNNNITIAAACAFIALCLSVGKCEMQRQSNEFEIRKMRIEKGLDK